MSHHHMFKDIAAQNCVVFKFPKDMDFSQLCLLLKWKIYLLRNLIEDLSTHQNSVKVWGWQWRIYQVTVREAASPNASLFHSSPPFLPVNFKSRASSDKHGCRTQLGGKKEGGGEEQALLQGNDLTASPSAAAVLMPLWREVAALGNFITQGDPIWCSSGIVS